MIRSFRPLAALGLGLWLVAGCGGGTGEPRAAEEWAQEGAGTPVVPGGATAGSNCSGSCADTPTFLTTADVQRVIAQAAAEASAHNAPATIAVVDRVGNVLAVYRMEGAPPQVTITSTDVVGAPVAGGLEGVNIIPAELAAIAKAITGAYLSTEGHAFTTRTASQIIQENFNPGERNQPSGPLFGVQFSQLPCGDFVARFDAGSGPSPGPHRSPLGLSADAGGLPLYKRGTVVGGVGVIGDGIYSLDKLSPTSAAGPEGFEFKLDEIAALAGSFGFAPNPERKADVITAVGKTLRYTDVNFTQLLSDPASAASFDSLIEADAGALRPVNGYYDGQTVHSGTAFGHPSSGIRPVASGEFIDADGNDLDAFVFVDAANVNRFPPRSATDTPGGDAANALTAAEVRTFLSEGLAVANRARAQIRRPIGSAARVTVSVVDSNGEILGMARGRDGPMFGADVSLQKARTSAFFSGTGRAGGPAPATAFAAAPRPRYLAAIENPGRFTVNPDGLVEALLDAIDGVPTPTISAYLLALQTFTGEANLLTASGDPVAFSNRAVGNLHRPFYPDGVAASPEGPLSKARNDWSIFSVGLQLDLVYNAIINHVAAVILGIDDAPTTCVGNTGFDPDALFQTPAPVTALANGMQIFPGGVPIYRGDVLVGGLGVSGDGVDQDDMVSFLGTHNAGQVLGTGVGNAPRAIRSDRIEPVGAANSERLRYVNCPQAPFNDTSEGGVCERADGEVQ